MFFSIPENKKKLIDFCIMYSTCMYICVYAFTLMTFINLPLYMLGIMFHVVSFLAQLKTNFFVSY